MNWTYFKTRGGTTPQNIERTNRRQEKLKTSKNNDNQYSPMIEENEESTKECCKTNLRVAEKKDKLCKNKSTFFLNITYRIFILPLYLYIYIYT